MINEIICMYVIALLALLEIDWNKATSGFVMALSEAEMGVEHVVTFLSLTQTDTGAVVASVDSDTIEGDTLWLAGKYGPQNGLLSLLNSADGGDNIEGNSFVFSRVESEASQTGYAYRWTKP